MAKRVVTHADRAVRDRLKLGGWVSDDDGRRRRYFRWCDVVLARLTDVVGGDEPPDESVIMAVIAMLRADDTLADHVDSKHPEFLGGRENWEAMYRAAAATIYHEYLVAVEKGDWEPGAE